MVFFYQSAEYIRTRDIFDAVGGNAPLIINKSDGSLHETGTGHSVECYIADYIKNLKE